MNIEVTEHALIVRGTIPLDAIDGIRRLAEAYGFDQLDIGAGRPLGATLVITNAEHAEDLRHEIERQAEIAAGGDALKKWLNGPDTGTSSLTLASVLANRPEITRDQSVPWDPSDFGRCLRLLEVMPGWRERLHEVAEAEPRWAPLVEHWDELEALYREEEPSGTAPRLYDRMKELIG